MTDVMHTDKPWRDPSLTPEQQEAALFAWAERNTPADFDIGNDDTADLSKTLSSADYADYKTTVLGWVAKYARQEHGVAAA